MPRPRLILFVVIMVALVVGLGDAWSYVPPRPATETAVRRAIEKYELVRAPLWPARLVGAEQLTQADRDALQREYARAAGAWSTGHELRGWRDWDYAYYLLTGRRNRHGMESVAGWGDVVSWDFRSRRLNGDLVVRAAVAHTFLEGRWDAAGRRLTGLRVSAVPRAVIADYTMRKVGGVWKVADVSGVKFLNLTTGKTTDEPAGPAAPGATQSP